MPLNPKHQRFIEEYLLDLDGAKAAVRAGFSPKSAKYTARSILAKPEIQAALAAAKAGRAERTKINADWLLRHLADEATADIADLYDDAGNIKPVKDWPKVWRTGLVAGFEVEELYEGRGDNRANIGRLRKVKLADRTRIKELIGKHIDVQAFKERVEHDASERFAEILNNIHAARHVAG